MGFHIESIRMSSSIFNNHNLRYFMSCVQSSKMKHFDKSSFFWFENFNEKLKKKFCCERYFGNLLTGDSWKQSIPTVLFWAVCLLMSCDVITCHSIYVEKKKYKRLHNAINSFSISCLVSAFQPLSRRKKSMWWFFISYYDMKGIWRQ